ncbi:MAG: hypothetical protein RL307_242 [Pseudomonadota bacterium]
MNPQLSANTQGLWAQLPALAQEIALAHAELAIAHPRAHEHLQAHLQGRLNTNAKAFNPGFEVELAVLALGFESEDAQLLAQAWLRQTARAGQNTPGADLDPKSWPSMFEDFEPEASQNSSPLKAHAPCPKRLGLYVVAPTADWIARLVEMGVPTVQLRFKSEDPKAIEREVQQAIAHASGSASHLYINDHWQLAIAMGAYGIHLGQEDIDGADFEAIRQSGLRLGLSTHGYSEMLRAAKQRPSYLALGAVYATNLKVMPTQPQGPKRLARYAALMGQRFPLVAIGGIDEERLDEVLPSGVGSVAAVRAILQAQDPAREAKRWMQRCPV